mmetsp:Transcript_84158/g.176093  ORF Transcript_84158/g.176093 Transcript_84158/m.176093 type:complete len:292 (+) Transcript_84158:2604-3479(+)
MIRGFLLVTKDQLLGLLFVLIRRLPNQDDGFSSEHRVIEHLQHLLSLFRDQVVSDFHNDVVPLLHLSCLINRLSQVVHLLQVAIPVVGSLSLPTEQATLLSPIREDPVADLEVARMFLLVEVEPIKGPLIRKTHWEQYLTLLLTLLYFSGNFNVGLRAPLNHVALEGERHKRRGSEIDEDAVALVADMGVECLALQVRRKRNGRGDSDTVLEETNGAVVFHRRIQVQQHANRRLSWNPLTQRRAEVVEDPSSLDVEADALRGRAEHEARVHSREAHPQNSPVVGDRMVEDF